MRFTWLMTSARPPRWRPSRPELFAARVWLVLVLVGASGRAAEDPGRFLAVKSWQGTYHHEVSGTSSQSIGPCTDTITIGQSVSAADVILSNFSTFGNVWSWSNDEEKISAQGGVTDRYLTSCPEGSRTTSVDLDYVTGGFSLTIDTNANQYVVAFGAMALTLEQDGQELPVVIGWGPPTTNALPASGLTLSGSTTLTLSLTSPSAALGIFAPIWAYISGTIPLVVNWTLIPAPEDVELVVEPEHFENWLPKGDLKSLTDPGNVLLVKARLQTPAGEIPQRRARWVRFELLDVSREPGVCMNRPSKDTAKDDPDLQFDASLNKPPIVEVPLNLTNSYLTATSPDGEYLEVEAAVGSYDFGAYGELKVTAQVNGQEIVGYLKTDASKAQKPIRLPRRQPNSHIGDAWKEAEGVTALADDDDNEDEPVGDTDKGDGLTLYEEYRGFSENRKHIRGDAKKKDFLVADMIQNDDTISGIELLQTQSGLRVHAKLLPDELQHASEPLNTTVNFNYGRTAPHLVDQHGILIRPRNTNDFQSCAGVDLNCNDDSPPDVPKTSQAVNINLPDLGWDEIATSDGGKVLTFGGAVTVAHELAHTVAVWHHGDTDREVQWSLDNGKIKENGVVIDLRNDENQPVDPTTHMIGDKPKMTYLGAPQGEHSGDANCIMRYACAETYGDPGSVIRHVDFEELDGITLCIDDQGTGVNAPNPPKAWPRYGNATDGRGKCKTQICVNDSKAGDDKHKR